MFKPHQQHDQHRKVKKTFGGNQNYNYVSISTLHKPRDNTTVLITKARADTILHFDTTVRDLQAVFPTTH